MKPLSEHLLALIAVAEDIRRWPPTRPIEFFEFPRGFAEVAASVRRAHQAPSEGIRATYAGVAMLDVVEAFAATGNDLWQLQIDGLLRLLKEDAWIALNNETSQRAEAYQR